MAETALARQLDSLAADAAFVLPELALAGGLFVALVAGLIAGEKRQGVAATVAALTLLAAGALSLAQLELPGVSVGRTLYSETLMLSPRAAVGKLFFALAGLVGAGLAWLHPPLAGARRQVEFWLFLLGLQFGLHLMAMANHWLAVYLAVEFASLGAYLLTAYLKKEGRAAEAGLKYIIYGSFASAVMLYGISMLYGLTGSLTLHDPEALSALLAQPASARLAALLLVFAGIAYKIAAVPFHFWAPDVYEGASAPVAGLLSAAPKAAGFLLALNFFETFPPLAPGLENWFKLLCGVAIAMMFWGNLAAFGQRNFKRLLAWSSIGQSGYLLMGALALPAAGAEPALLVYLAVYGVSSLAAFGLAGFLAEQTGSERHAAWAGLGRALPFQAFALAVLMISLTGLPPLPGFFAKLQLFLPVWRAYETFAAPGFLAMLAAAALNTVISLFYYLKAPAAMILRPAPEQKTQLALPQRRIKLALLAALLAGLFALVAAPVFNWASGVLG